MSIINWGKKERIMPNKSFPRSQTLAEGRREKCALPHGGLHPSPGPDSHITIYMALSIVLIPEQA